MGNTTIIELNHDYANEIERNKDLFVNQILEHLRAGGDHEKGIEGKKIITFFPRYTENKKYTAWERWKTKWARR